MSSGKSYSIGGMDKDLELVVQDDEFVRRIHEQNSIEGLICR